MDDMDAAKLSEEFATSVLPVTTFFGVLGVFGGLGNVFVLFVYRYKYPPCNFRTFVTCLAITDFVSCLFVFPCEIAGHRMWFSYPASAAWFCKLKTGVFAVAVMTTSIILLLISIDRFRKVCRPFGWQISVQNAFKLCVMSVIISVVMTAPIPILFGIQHENITYQGCTFEITSCECDDAYKNTLLMPLYLIFFYYSPIAAFMLTTTLLYSMMLKNIFSKRFLRASCICYNERERQSHSGITPNSQKESESQAYDSGFKTVGGSNNSGRYGDVVNENSIRVDETAKAISDADEGVVSKTPGSEFSVKKQIESRNEIESTYRFRSDTDNSIIQDHRNRLTAKKHRITRKTIIMFFVTLIFNVTMLIYFCILFTTVRRKHVLEIVDTGTAAIFFLCWRIYFINHVINPVVYGLLDYRFREALTRKNSSRTWYQ